MRYLVIATRPTQFMRMGWDTRAEQTSCARLYARQGWRVAIADCETELHERIVDKLYNYRKDDERACSRISIFPIK